jgi:hypothetical protein
MTSTPTPKNVRLTISVTPEVHATFERMAKASSMSLSRAMGEWLTDTSEAAEHMASLLERARGAPKQVVREMHAYALGLADETEEVLENMRKKGQADRLAEAAQRARPAGLKASPPRPVIRGGKSPGKTLATGPRGSK